MDIFRFLGLFKGFLGILCGFRKEGVCLLELEMGALRERCLMWGSFWGFVEWGSEGFLLRFDCQVDRGASGSVGLRKRF